ncbi:MAG TPA: type II toxin-antitoxin system RelE/ParE family toxin [Fibrobacteraceae bacterium]|nr:type II toxin-antitoxin system RelE/ParE family toxin [Fibrobacteraceae bacterium]
MTFRVQLSPKSAEDIENIVDSSMALSQRAAEETYNSLIDCAESLGEFTERGRFVPELLDEGIRKYRELIHGNFQMIYRINGGTVTIVRVIDSRQLLEMKAE